MTYQVTIRPTGQQFVVKDHQTILDAALEAGIVIPYSCRGGTCCSCKGKLLQGELQEMDLSHVLEATELEAGYTLCCQAKPSTDIEIEVQVLRMAGDIQARKMPVRVMGLDRLSSDVMRVTLQMPANEPFNFYPGQYLEFILKGNARRSYSIANIPNEQNLIELHIRHLPGGLFTDHVFGAGETAMKVREILRIEGPMGTFFLREDHDHPLIFVATGTGFAPLKGILEHMFAKGITRPVHFYWGGRQLADLYAHEQLSQWAATYDFLNYTPVLSRAGEEWEGQRGYVQEAILRDFSDLQDYEVYACGSPVMIDSLRHELLTKAQLPSEQFFADAFMLAK